MPAVIIPGSRSLALDWTAFVGRCLLAFLFLREGIGKIGNAELAAAYMARYGMPSQLLPVGTAIEIGTGAMIVLGWRTRPASLLLALFCVVAAFVFHRNWDDRNQFLHFEKDLALAGALLVLAARGAGDLSIDGRFRK